MLVEPADGRLCDDDDPTTMGEICIYGACREPVYPPQEYCPQDQVYIDDLVQYGELPGGANIPEQFNQALIEAGGGRDKGTMVSMTLGDPMVVPVVVHLMQHPNFPEIEGIEYEQVVQVIDALNQRYATIDLARLRTDFRPVAATSHLRFKLAGRTDQCSDFSDPGLNRVAVDTEENPSGEFSVATNVPEYADENQGGLRPWDTSQYLNIYVSKHVYTTLPTPPGRAKRIYPDDSGRLFASVGVDVGAFEVDSAVLAHEIGHYFGLEHVNDVASGDGPAGCLGLTDGEDGTCLVEGDLVCDTPGSLGTNHCDATANTCVDQLLWTYGDSDPPDQDENYMNSLNAGCESMFSFGQVVRMESGFAVSATDTIWHPSELLGSVASSPPVAEPDLWIRAGEGDNGTVPYEGEVAYASSDIWVRHTDDDVLVHENPLFGQTNVVHVRVSNRSCGTTAPASTVSLYWAKASTGLAWPDPWDGSRNTGEAVLGETLDTIDVPALGPGESFVAKFPWDPPDPQDYVELGADKSHFCLLAHVDGSPQPTDFLAEEVRGNNDMAWKNVSVVSELDGYLGYVSVGNPSSFPQRLVFEAPEGETSIFDWGTLYVDMAALFGRWDAVEVDDLVSVPSLGTEVLLLGSGARLRGMEVSEEEFLPLTVRFVPFAGDDEEERELMDVYRLRVTQYAEVPDGSGGITLEEVGGQLILLKTTVPIFEFEVPE